VDNRITFATDDDIRQAQDEMIHAINTMFDHIETEAGYQAKYYAKYFISYILALDPAKIAADFDRAYDIANELGAGDKAAGQLQLTRRHLSAWKGKAADQFDLQITYMEKFCEEEKDLMLEARRGVGAALAAAVLSRESYRNLLDATTAAAINAHEERKDRDTEAKVAIVGNVASTILGLHPANLQKSAAELVVNLGKDLTPIYLDDGGAERVCADFQRNGKQLCEQLQQAYENVRINLAEIRDATANATALFAPLPAYCDVDSPDFTYEHFKNGIHDPGPIGPLVETERKKHSEEREQESEIERRLHPRGEI
jgi:hypothetical protein